METERPQGSLSCVYLHIPWCSWEPVLGSRFHPSQSLAQTCWELTAIGWGGQWGAPPRPENCIVTPQTQREGRMWPRSPRLAPPLRTHPSAVRVPAHVPRTALSLCKPFAWCPHKGRVSLPAPQSALCWALGVTTQMRDTEAMLLLTRGSGASGGSSLSRLPPPTWMGSLSPSRGDGCEDWAAKDKEDSRLSPQLSWTLPRWPGIVP